MTKTRRDRGVTTVEWVIVAMVIGVGCIAVWRTFKDQYMQPTAERMGDCIEAAAGDGNLCGGLAAGGASNGGTSSGGGASAGGALGGALAQNGNGGVAGAVGGNGATGNGAGGGMSAGELANSVGGGGPGGDRAGGAGGEGGGGAGGERGGGGGGGAGGEGGGGENGHTENPRAGLINGVAQGMGLAAAAEDGLIDLTKWRNGIELTPGMENAFKAVRAGEGAIIGVPLDVLANGLPRNPNDGASLAVKTGIIGAAGWFGGPLGAAAAVGLDKSLGYISDSVTGGTRYQDDWQDSWAYQIAHLPPGTIGKDAELQRQQYEQQMIHEELQYQREQQQRDQEALQEMMKR